LGADFFQSNFSSSDVAAAGEAEAAVVAGERADAKGLLQSTPLQTIVVFGVYDRFGHTPLSVEDKIGLKCQRLVIGSGPRALPVMADGKRDRFLHFVRQR
jgi:hypothetical protein